MSKRFTPPVSIRLDDEGADRVARNLDQRVRELGAVRIAQGILIEDVDLADATEVTVNHGLGRFAKWIVCRLLNPSTSGRIEEVVSGSIDRKNALALKASGYGATVTVDLWVF